MPTEAGAAGTIRVAIVSEVRLLRDALTLALGACADIAVIGSGTRLDELTTQSLDDAIVLLELPILRDRDAIDALRASASRTRFVAFAVADSDDDILACAEAGLSGYVLSNGTVDDLVGTLRAVARDELPLSPRAASILFRHVGALASRQVTSTAEGPSSVSPRDADRLTSREGEVLRLLEQGCSNKEIAGRLNIEVTTVKNHVHHILEKMHLTRRGQAAAALRSSARKEVSAP